MLLIMFSHLNDDRNGANLKVIKRFVPVLGTTNVDTNLVSRRQPKWNKVVFTPETSVL